MRDRCREDINNSYYSIPQSQQAQQSSSHHHHQQQSVATSTSDVEQLNGNNTNNNNNSLVISPPSSLHIHQSSQQSLASSNASSVTSSQQQQQQQQTITPSVLYTVQRVVPTSQLPSNYGSNSNASSLTSIIARNETDCGLPNNNGKFFLFEFYFFITFLFHVINYNYQCNYPCAIKNWQCPWQSFYVYVVHITLMLCCVI